MNLNSSSSIMPLARRKELFFLRLEVLNRSAETIIWYHHVLDPLNDESVDNYFSTLRVHYGPSTIRRFYVGLKTFYQWSIAEGFIEHSPLRNFPKPSAPKTIIVPLVATQMAALMAAFGSKFSQIRNKAMTALLLDSGLRASELCGLRISDVVFNLQTVKVVGKGSKERNVPFGQRTKSLLWKYHLRAPERDYFFITSFGQRLERRNLNLIYSHLSKRLGFHIHPHLLRHTMATQYIRNGGDPVSLMEILGHSDLQTTMIYVKLAGKDIKLKHAQFSPMDRLI